MFSLFISLTFVYSITEKTLTRVSVDVVSPAVTMSACAYPGSFFRGCPTMYTFFFLLC